MKENNVEPPVQPKRNGQSGIALPGTSLSFTLAVMLVALISAGLVGKVGERLAGRGGFLIGSFGTAIVVALAVGLLFGKIRHWTHSLYWLFGVPLALAGIQLCPVLVPGFRNESGSDQI